MTSEYAPSPAPPLVVWAATALLLALVAAVGFVAIVWFDLDPLVLLG